MEAVKPFVGSGGAVATNVLTEAEAVLDARDALVDLAESGRVQLLIMASRGPSALKRCAAAHFRFARRKASSSAAHLTRMHYRRASMGSVCSYVIQHAQIPLVIVPPLSLVEEGQAQQAQ